MENVISTENLMILGYWIAVVLVVMGCVGVASAWTKYEENYQ